jgi:hypothetical protein
MENSPFTAKWTMINTKSFIAEKEGYTMMVRLTGCFPYWSIIKDGVIVDECYYHKMQKCELSTRIQAERCLNKILNNK